MDVWLIERVDSDMDIWEDPQVVQAFLDDGAAEDKLHAFCKAYEKENDEVLHVNSSLEKRGVVGGVAGTVFLLEVKEARRVYVCFRVRRITLT